MYSRCNQSPLTFFFQNFGHVGDLVGYIFLDYCCVFDSVLHPLLLRKLGPFGCPVSKLLRLKDYFSTELNEPHLDVAYPVPDLTTPVFIKKLFLCLTLTLLT